MRLIDADKIDFREVFKGESDFAKVTREAAQELINNQPTAYDVNKVVEQLEERMCGAEDEATDVGCYMRNLHFRDAIEVVKSGGIE